MVIMKLILFEEEMDDCKQSGFPYKILDQISDTYIVEVDVPKDIAIRIDEDMKIG